MDASGTTQTPQNESDHAEPVQIAQGADASVVEIAQAPAAGLEGAVGQISNIFGTVSVVRADGTRVEAGMGAPIFEGDLIVTETGSEVEVVFADGTNAFLDQEGRLLVERVTPNAPPGESSAFFVVLEGAFTFSAPADTGNGAGNIDVRTPVATVNVQGGRVAGRAAPEAELNLFTLVRNFDGSLGRILISTTAGTLALTTELQAAEVFSLFREPDGGQVPIDQLTAVIGERTMNLIGGSPTGDPVASGPRGSEFVQVAQNNLQQNDAQSFGNGGPNPLGFGRETAFLDNVRGRQGDDNNGIQDKGQESTFTPTTSAATGPTTLSAGTSTGPAGGGSFIYLSGTGAVDFTGGAGIDTITLQGDQASVNTFNVTTSGSDVVTDLGGGNTLTMRGVETLAFQAGNSGDTVNLVDLSGTDITNNTVKFFGGAGDDTLNGALTARRIVASGGDGDDTLISSTENDTLNGDGGNDTLTGGAGADSLDGGAGSDTASYATAAVGVTADLATPANNTGDAAGDTYVSIENLTGSAHADTLTGDGNANTLNGGAGSDTLNGGAGDDTLNGGADTDTASYASSASGVTVDLAAGTATGDGSDTLTSIENVIGSGFNDTLTGDGNANTLTGGAGDDTLRGGGGNDTLNGTSGTNTLEGGAGNDALNGGSGIDTATYANAGSAITASLTTGTATGDGTDTFSGIENLIGSVQGDTLTGDANANALSGGNGDDVLEGRGGDDLMNGEAGTDTASYANAGAGVTVDLSAGTATGDGTDALVSIENVTGSAHADTLTGDGNANVLTGGAGDDSLIGGAGNDTLNGTSGTNTLDGGAGNDALNGGTGTDTATYASASASVTVNLTSGTATGDGTDTLSGIENVIGSAQDDALTGDSGNNVLTGGLGNDTLDGRTGDDTLNGGGGIDTASYANAASAVSVNLTNGTASGGDGADTLTSIENVIGSNGNDTIVGTTSANTLDGGAGNDLLTGSGGGDTLIGGSGTDTVQYNTSASGVTVDLSNNANNAGGALGDTLSSIENLVGSSLDDTLTGDANVNILSGSGGNDTLHGGGAGDTLDGGTGNDILNGDAGDDTLFGRDGVDTLNGGTGNDTLNGDAGVDTLNGGADNDTLNGGADNDILNGDDGNDILSGDAGADTLNGGSGTDTASYASAASAVTADLANAANNTGDAAGDTYNSIENLTGSNFDDTLSGNANANAFDGGGGNDTVSYTGSAAGLTADMTTPGNNTNDALGDTYTGIESLTGTAFADTLTGDGSANILTGGDGNDILNGNGGSDTLIGGAGNDALNGGNGTDTLFGGTGDDAFDGGDGSDTVSFSGSGFAITASLAAGTATGDGSDTIANVENLIGSNLADTLSGDGNANTLLGGGGQDTLNGGAGNDTLNGGADDDILNGGDDDDILIGGAGADALEGNAGSDTASYAGSAGLTADLSNSANNTGNASGDTYSSIENLTGTSNADTLIGDGNANIISGDGGDDTLIGGGGADSLIGGTGTDTASYVSASAAVTVDFSNTANNTGDAAGDSYTSIENIIGSNFDDRITGTDSAVSPQTPTLSIQGMGGNDTLIGGNAVNTIDGGTGNDLIHGGAGNDTLTGGADSDTFYFATTSDGTDAITDFVSGTDQFQFLQANFGNITAVDNTNFSTVSGAYANNGAHAGPSFIFADTPGAGGTLIYDADGNGAGAGYEVATITGDTMTAADISITAASPV